MRSRALEPGVVGGALCVSLALTSSIGAQQNIPQQNIPLQNLAQQNLAHKIDFPHDAPVTLAGDEWGGSAGTVRGGAYAIDVRVALSLRNASQRRIRGITLAVLAQES